MSAPAVVSAVVVACSDPAELARFWHALLGGRVVTYPDLGVAALRAPGITVDFATVADEKTTKNRWHLDLATDEPEALADYVIELGGATADDFPRSEGCIVLRDPEGNEFCILRHAPAQTPWEPPPGAAP